MGGLSLKKLTNLEWRRAWRVSIGGGDQHARCGRQMLTALGSWRSARCGKPYHHAARICRYESERGEERRNREEAGRRGKSKSARRKAAQVCRRLRPAGVRRLFSRVMTRPLHDSTHLPPCLAVFLLLPAPPPPFANAPDLTPRCQDPTGVRLNSFSLSSSRAWSA